MHKVVAFKRPVTPAPDVPMQGYVIRNFTPNWFATTMGTGILSVALAQFPGHPWLFAMGQALWLFNILLFATCTTLYTARWLLYFHEASRVFSHSVVSMFFGCIPMGLATIINGFLIYGIPHIGGTEVAIATTLWWINVTLPVALGLGVVAVVAALLSGWIARSETGSTRLLGVIGLVLGLLIAAIVFVQGAASVVVSACAR